MLPGYISIFCNYRTIHPFTLIRIFDGKIICPGSCRGSGQCMADIAVWPAQVTIPFACELDPTRVAVGFKHVICAPFRHRLFDHMKNTDYSAL